MDFTEVTYVRKVIGKQFKKKAKALLTFFDSEITSEDKEKISLEIEENGSSDLTLNDFTY